MTKTGTGTLTLSGVNSYSGGTVVGSGTIRAGATDVFGTGSIQVNGGATLDLNSLNQTVGSLAGTGNVTLGSATLNAGNDNTSTSFNGVISGTGGLVKSGNGTLTVRGANTYTGGTTVSGGTLVGATTSIQGNVTDNAQLDFNQNTNGSFAGSIFGSGSLTKSGTGTVT